ncbi:MAG: chloride channel protein [Clostridia bacterium]|nr:chloride channel protein [Clostridia bacterium]
MQIGIELIWTSLPSALHLTGSSAVTLIYNLIVCFIGAILIALVQKHYGPLPDTMEEVLGSVKRTGTYPHDTLHHVAVAALLPLIFGGALGPEAGLTGLVVGICYWIGDNLQYRNEQVSALAEAGFAAIVGVIFGSPLFGIAHALEPDDKSENYRQKLSGKRARILIYCCGVLGGMLAFYLLGTLTRRSAGLPRFHAQHAIGIDQWKWLLPLLAAGIVFALFYLTIQKLTRNLADKLSGHFFLCSFIAAAAVAIAGAFLPMTMFSGEHDLKVLIDSWQSTSPVVMILTAIVKLALVSLCINFGWRGGSIFPIIFSGALLGYTFALLVGMDGAFAVAMLVSAMYAYIMRKPVAVVMILLLCFPVTYIFPIAVSAILASKIPTPFHR